MVSVLRWGWRPAEFWRLTAGEQAFVIAGLKTELELKEKYKGR